MLHDKYKRRLGGRNDIAVWVIAVLIVLVTTGAWVMIATTLSKG